MQLDKWHAKPMGARVCWISAAVVLISACASTSFDRHNLSRLWVEQPSGQIFFDATANESYPHDSASADAIREEWMAEWLKLRNMCLEGFSVNQRRFIGSGEVNPHRHNLRYSLTCQ